MLCPGKTAIKMVKPKGRRTRRGRRSGAIDLLHFPLLYFAQAGNQVVTSVKSLQQVFDRNRAFRIASFRGEMTAIKYPVVVQFLAFSPVNTSDNVWSSPLMTVPTGVVRRFRFRIPAAENQWYPSDAADNTVIFQLNVLCLNKDFPGYVEGGATLMFQMRPVEVLPACPKLMEAHPFPSTSAVETPSPSVSVLGSSSDEEYFST